MAGPGWTGAAIPETSGGIDVGLAAIAVLAEKLGREFVSSPLGSTGLVAVAARGEQAKDLGAPLLLSIASGYTVIALAVDEGPRHDSSSLGTRATRAADGLHLTGRKAYVVDGIAADWFICSAQTDRATLFLVPRDAAQATTLDTIHGRDIAHVVIDADLSASAELSGGADLIARLTDLARLGVAAEMIGAAERALQITLFYLRTRQQFGRYIRSFRRCGIAQR